MRSPLQVHPRPRPKPPPGGLSSHRQDPRSEGEKTEFRQIGVGTTLLLKLSGQFSKSVLKLKSKRATRAVEIKKLLADAQENEEAQHTATETRAKENAAYMAKRAEMQEAAAAMEKALTVLSSQALLKVSSALRNAQHVHFSAKQREWLQLLEQEGWTGVANAPQSATIQGILVNLNETLIKSLEKAEHSEATLHRHFEKLMNTKQDEFLAMRETVSKKQCSHDEAVCLLQSFDEHFKKRRETKKERDCVDVKSRWREQHEMLQCAMRCVSQSPPSLRGAKDVLHRMGIRLPLDLKDNFDPCDPGCSGKAQLMKLLIADLQRKVSDKEVMQQASQWLQWWYDGLCVGSDRPKANSTNGALSIAESNTVAAVVV